MEVRAPFTIVRGMNYPPAIHCMDARQRVSLQWTIPDVEMHSLGK